MSVHNLVFLIAATISACAGGTSISPASSSGVADASSAEATDVSTLIELRYDEIARYRDLTFRWIGLEDSRCQIGVQCVWAGQLLATIEVARGQEAPLEVELLHRIKSEPEATIVHGYALRLKDVSPHPKRGVTPSRSDYLMRFTVSKL